MSEANVSSFRSWPMIVPLLKGLSKPNHSPGGLKWVMQEKNYKSGVLMNDPGRSNAVLTVFRQGVGPEELGDPFQPSLPVLN